MSIAVVWPTATLHDHPKSPFAWRSDSVFDIELDLERASLACMCDNEGLNQFTH